ncbi:putative clathrin heavy chain [Neolecta irregularis DAH-3]|uniref:Clathrin heavy chain n=1 Tax=Neolecta irregularis (strain DAH-3) TaxID=1198029 RepID=A0A1U7LSI7_NEOID|nr:putative clathrin heavy chain [Neolecta irregularis DAH-3]|eukprot:OLL25481.1 putative clathrin heavy chain [Neolecta irregularis DAH-3]
MSDPLPIKFQELVQLPNLGISPASMGFNTCTMESDRYICVRETNSGPAQVAIIDLLNNNNIIKRPIQADSVIMHPHDFVIALRALRTLQIFNLQTKSKIKSHAMDEDIVFWKWISDTTIGIVTSTAVYHWSIEGSSSPPVRMFLRHDSLTGSQIINYRVNSNEKWFLLSGIIQRDGRVAGCMQLYNKDRGQSQAIEGHAGAFSELRLEGAPSDTQVFSFAVRTATGAKLHIIEIDHDSSNPAFPKKAVDFYFPEDQASDFPVSMQISKKYSVVFVVTKNGYIHLYDLETAICIYVNRISTDSIFVTCPHSQSGGIIGINRKGSVLIVTVDENTIIPYIMNNLGNTQVAVRLASRANLPGADDLYVQRFNQLLQSGDYLEAAKVAANSPRGILRTTQTIDRLKPLQAAPGSPVSPIFQYFGVLLDKGSLNKLESLELTRPVIQNNKKQLLEKWMGEGKLTCSEELGDLVRTADINLALQIYVKANSPHKVVPALAELGQFEKIVPYANKVGYSPDWAALLQHIVRINPEKGGEFATQLANAEGGSLVDVERVVNVFMAQNMVQQATSFLIDALKDDLPEQADLQTRLLEMNLLNAPQVADAILGNAMYHHFDKAKIAALCEKVGLVQRALEYYENPSDIKRVVVRTEAISPEWLVEYFGTKSSEISLECLHEILKTNIRQNLQLVVQIATKYSDQLGPVHIIDLFEQFKTAEGLFYYLGSIVNISSEPEVHFKYIQAATRLGQFKEVERICRESQYYNPEKVKNFLKEEKMADQLPLIIVCDRFNFVHDLVLYLYNLQQYQAIEVYVQQVNPGRAPVVVGALLDVDCDEQVVKNLLGSVRGQVPINQLVVEVEKRNRLKLLLPFLEATLEAGSQDQAVFNALAKIYIDSNNNPEKFLKENNAYDSLVVGKYCEKRDPFLAFIAYQKGENDLELVKITNENSMFRDQARYLVKRRQLDLWLAVLDQENIYRRNLIDQVVATAVPESTDPEDVSVVVKALMQADLPHELIELLEKIILEPSPFSDNSNLQNLLILTAIKSDKARVMEYVRKLNGYGVDDIAEHAIEHGLAEEAFEIYKKYEMNVEATNVLVEHIVSLDRAAEFAERIDTPEVWTRLGKAQLDGVRIKDAIDSYIKANNPENHVEVTELAARAGKHEELISYLQMARKIVREPLIDSSLLFTYAKTDRLNDMENLLSATNVANVQEVGEQCYQNKLYRAAKILFTSISNWAQLASTLVHLGEHQNAVDCARKANSTKVWKQVNQVCVDQKEFRLAQICGLNLIVHAEELSDLIKQYEWGGYFNELISLLEAGLALERSHRGMFTELAICYAKYRPETLMEHLKLFWSRVNIPKVISACEKAHLWPELVFLHVHYDEPDAAALAMIERSADAWNHSSFKEIVVKVANLEIYYKALNFYLEQHPMLLTDLLAALTPRIDHTRVIKIFEKSDNIPLIRQYLVAVQSKNIEAVNQAYNELLIEDEDYKGLRDSVSSYTNINQLELASRLEKHSLLEFRRISAFLYRRNKKWSQSISLSKEDKLYKDAIETARESNSREVSEELMQYFVDVGNEECFVAVLYTCYDLLRPDIVLEQAWRHGLSDHMMPFMINYMRIQDIKIQELEKDNNERKAREVSSKGEDETPIMGNRLMLTAGNTLSPQPIPYASMQNGLSPQMTPQMTGFRTL